MCEFCRAAWPSLTGDDFFHGDDPRLPDIARALADVAQGPNPTDEQVGWFIDDADAIVGDWPGHPGPWVITDWNHSPTDPECPEESWVGIDLTFTLNGVPYVIQESEFESMHPVKRDTYLSWHAEDATEASESA
ncbi:MAG: hypothetical protein PSX37_01910 [bacterium]|nr:hypothetical protein [bacterium]